MKKTIILAIAIITIATAAYAQEQERPRVATGTSANLDISHGPGVVDLDSTAAAQAVYEPVRVEPERVELVLISSTVEIVPNSNGDMFMRERVRFKRGPDAAEEEAATTAVNLSELSPQLAELARLINRMAEINQLKAAQGVYE
jgi:hypothetical protein